MIGRDAMETKAKHSDVPTGKFSRKYYENQLVRLQIELVQMQLWVKEAKAKIVVLFEGRDAAGKGGVIKRITERTSPRVFRVVALPVPSERERTQVFAQRYIERFPAGGEICLFDRSWYNRAGVDRVMGFANDEQYERFLQLVPMVEEAFIAGGIQIIKYWFEVSRKSRPAASRTGRGTRARFGSSAQWTLSRTVVGTTIPAPAMPCSVPPTPRSAPGTSLGRTTSAVLA